MRTESNAPPSKGIILSFFSFIDDHPNLPNTLSYWAQLGLNSFFIVFLMFIFYSFWATIRSDVDEKSREAAADILVEMAMCTKEFRDNKCDSASRVPAMELVCNNWEKCMQRDPSKVGRARISAKTFAQIFDSFVEPISPKAMVGKIARFRRFYADKVIRYSALLSSSSASRFPTLRSGNSETRLLIRIRLCRLMPRTFLRSRWSISEELSITSPHTQVISACQTRIREPVGLRWVLQSEG